MINIIISKTTDYVETNPSGLARIGARVRNKNAQQLHSGETNKNSKSHPKTSKLYWHDKVKKPASSAGGESPHYGIQLAHDRRRMRFSLDSGNKDVAAAKAAQIWTMLATHGWQETLAKFKPNTATTTKAQAATVGALIEAATRLSSARPESMEAYAKAMRRITAGVMGLDSGKKYDFKRGSEEWRAKVDATPLEKLTPARVLAWKNAFLKAATTPDKRNHASVTVNSLMRNSKALLSKRIAPFIAQEIELPTQLWFQGITSEEEPSLRYRSKIDAGTIIAAARKELADEKPETFKLLLLTLVCGLRRSEADSLLWEQVDFDRKVISIRDTDFKRLKSKDSGGDIGMDDELVAMLRGYHTNASGPFILETPKRARKEITEHKSHGYRCDATHKALIEWLREKGVPKQRPLHTLRKEIGSIIASRDGIFKASRYLRHSDIRITSRLYADTKVPVCAGLGAMLASTAGNVESGDFKGPAQSKEAKTSKAKGQRNIIKSIARA